VSTGKAVLKSEEQGLLFLCCKHGTKKLVRLSGGFFYFTQNAVATQRSLMTGLELKIKSTVTSAYFSLFVVRHKIVTRQVHIQLLP
jgi:hypothetical protein